jgi:hypothetical protein
MSTFDYTKAQATAKRLIKRFGREVTLVITAGSGDAWNPVQSGDTQTLVAAVFDYKNSKIDGTLIKTGDKRLLISTEGATIAPDLQHKIAIEDIEDEHSIVDLKPLSPGGTVVYWEAQVRK